MRIASVAEVKAQLSAHMRACKEGPVIITRNGKPAAVLLAVDDEDELDRPSSSIHTVRRLKSGI